MPTVATPAIASLAVTSLREDFHLRVDTHAGRTKKKDRLSRRSLRNPIRCFDQAAAMAAEFFFVPRYAKKPRPAKPAISIVQVEGSGVAVELNPVTNAPVVPEHDGVSAQLPLYT